MPRAQLCSGYRVNALAAGFNMAQPESEFQCRTPPDSDRYCSADVHRSTWSATRKRWSQNLASTIKWRVAAEACGNLFPSRKADSVTKNIRAVHWRNFLSNAKVGNRSHLFWGRCPEPTTQPRCPPMSASAVFPGIRGVGSLGNAGKPTWLFDGFVVPTISSLRSAERAQKRPRRPFDTAFISPSTSHLRQAAVVVFESLEPA